LRAHKHSLDKRGECVHAIRILRHMGKVHRVSQPVSGVTLSYEPSTTIRTALLTPYAERMMNDMVQSTWLILVSTRTAKLAKFSAGAQLEDSTGISVCPVV
jgi:hypothetical protein